MANGKFAFNKKVLILAMSIVSVFFSFLIVACFGIYNTLMQDKELMNKGQKVSAQIESVTVVSGAMHTGGDFVLKYRYIHDDGTIYTGICGSFYYREEAEKHIGEKVEIYIDGGGKSIPADRKINPGSSIIWAVVFIVLFCACIAGIVILSAKVIKENKLKKQV